MSNQQPLQHAYPSMEPPEGEPWSDDLREVWIGKMRIIKNRRRKKLLERRGVPLLKAEPRIWLWFTEPSPVISTTGGAA